MNTLDLSGIKVYVGDDVHHVYEQLVSRSPKQAENHPFETFKDLFVLAACIGARHSLYKELDSSRDVFSGEVFSVKTDVPILAALAYAKTQDLETLDDPKEVVRVNQGWANGGIQIVHTTLLEGSGRPLFNLASLILAAESESTE